jgi:hypothetical protein
MNDQAEKVAAVLREAGIVLPGLNGDPAAGQDAGGEKRELPYVEIQSVLAPMASEIGTILAGNGVFKRQRAVVTIDDAGRLEEMSARRFRTYVEKCLVPFKWVARGKNEFERKPESLGVDTAGTLLESDQFLIRQRELLRTATVRQPVRRRDGRIELLPYGYDEEARTFTARSGVDFDLDVSLDAARLMLRDILREFPLNDRKPDGTSRNEAGLVALALSVFGAGLLSPTARRLNAMLSSNSVGSGKTLLGQFLVIPTYGVCDLQPVPETEENWRKILDTECLAGSPVIFFDDIEGFFKSSILNAFLTAPTWTGRRMHSQSKFTVPKLAMVILTGNDLEVSQDVARRFLHVKMLVDEANPQEREIQREIDDGWLASAANRSQILSALWAIVREWDAAGRPRPKRVVRGYEEWCRVFAGMAEFAGFGDALEPLPVEDSGNSELADMVALIEALIKVFDESDLDELPAGFDRTGRTMTVDFSCITNAAWKCNSFVWALKGKEKDGVFEVDAAGRSKFGKLLGRFGGKKFTLRDGRKVRWDTPGKKRGKHYVMELLSGKL